MPLDFGDHKIAEAEGVSANTEFAVAAAKDFPGEGYDLVCFFDPVGRVYYAARR